MNIYVKTKCSKEFLVLQKLQKKGGIQMLKIKKIQKRLEIKDVAVQSDSCKWLWIGLGIVGGTDCLNDCNSSKHPASYASQLY